MKRQQTGKDGDSCERKTTNCEKTIKAVKRRQLHNDVDSCEKLLTAGQRKQSCVKCNFTKLRKASGCWSSGATKNPSFFEVSFFMYRLTGAECHWPENCSVSYINHNLRIIETHRTWGQKNVRYLNSMIHGPS